MRQGDDELLVYLDPRRFDLAKESAVLVTALMRLYVGAIAIGPPASRLDEDELRLLGERVLRAVGHDSAACDGYSRPSGERERLVRR